MAISFDRRKSERNRDERGLPFEVAADFDWATAIVAPSKAQKADTSTRFFALGMIGRTAHVLIFTFGATGIRLVSLRRASKKEIKLWHASRTRT